MLVTRKRIDAWLVTLDRLLALHSVTLLRWSVGAIFLGFGFLKFFPGASPAEAIATRTTSMLTFGLVGPDAGLLGVALMECTIGLTLLSGRLLGVGLALLAAAFAGILSPLVLLSGELFTGPSNAPNLLGQYVLKDIVLVTAGLVVAARALSERNTRVAGASASFAARHKMEIVLAGLAERKSTHEICDTAGVSQETYLRWQHELLDGAARTFVACHHDAQAGRLLDERIAVANDTARRDEDATEREQDTAARVI